MIYAKVNITKKSDLGNDVLFIRFYGDKEKTAALREEIKDSGESPYSFLAKKGFIPSSEKFFHLL